MSRDMPHSFKNFSTKDRKRFAQAWDSGAQLIEMSKEFGIPYQVAKSYRVYLNLEPRYNSTRLTGRRRAIFLDLWGKGVCVKRIAHEMGVSTRTVYEMRRRSSLPIRASKEKRVATGIEFDQSELRDITRRAYAHGMSFSAYVRLSVREMVKKDSAAAG